MRVAGIVLVTLCAALAALIESLLVPLYAGTVIVPIGVLLAIVGNVALPRMALAFVPRTAASLAPVLAWLAVILLLFNGRPEGDVVFPAQPTAAEWVFYGTVVGGFLAGVATVALIVPPPVRREAGRPVTR